MKKTASRSVARSAKMSHQDFVAWWTTAMWAAAAVYLFATFAPY